MPNAYFIWNPVNLFTNQLDCFKCCGQRESLLIYSLIIIIAFYEDSNQNVT